MCGDDTMITPSLEDEAPTMGPITDEDPGRMHMKRNKGGRLRLFGMTLLL
jgi:hypothetical protein